MILKRYFSIFKNFDWILLSSVALLICFGLAALYSITISFDSPDFTNFNKQIIFALVGFLIIFIVGSIDYRIWRDLSNFIYGAAVLLLVAVLFFGSVIRGTKGWFSILGFNFQPVEIAKLALIIFLAAFLSKQLSELKNFKTFFLGGMSAAFLFFLVVLQPDLGSALILFFIWFVMAFSAGTKKNFLLVVVTLILITFVFSWFFVFADYQKDRLLIFINPDLDPYGRGYHVRQASIAVGAGGLLGRGLGFGSQSQLKFIPDSQTDFIFAVIAEELGFVGVGVMLALWGIIFYRMIKVAMRTKDDFAALFIIGVSAIFFGQIMINIGMNVGLMPVTGISLPFLSYGGSFLLISMLLIGMVQSMASRS